MIQYILWKQLDFNTCINRICYNDNPLSIFRSNNYTEFKTCTRCNPVVTDTYDSLETTTIGMYVDR